MSTRDDERHQLERELNACINAELALRGERDQLGASGGQTTEAGGVWE